MEIKELETEKILQPATDFEQINLGATYTINPFLGCTGNCVFCVNRNIYKNEDCFTIYKNAPDLLITEIMHDYKGGVVVLGTKTELFQKNETATEITYSILDILKRHKIPVHIITKSNRILKSREISLLRSLNNEFLVVSMSIFTTDNKTASIFEPDSPNPVKRFEAVNVLSRMGIKSGILFGPVLPKITDDFDELENVIKMAKSYNAGYVLPRPVLLMNSDFKKFFYSILKKHYPSLVKEYASLYSSKKALNEERIELLKSQINFLCDRYQIETQVPLYSDKNILSNGQLSMFDNGN